MVIIYSYAAPDVQSLPPYVASLLKLTIYVGSCLEHNGLILKFLKNLEDFDRYILTLKD